MRDKLVATAILVFLLIPPLAAAKSIVFVTGNDACHRGSCLCLDSEEAAFCTRLSANLGYNITIIGESYVLANHSSEWWAFADKANLIFLGNTRERTADVTADRDRFCGNISIVTAKRKVFATFISAYKSGDNIAGCAFSPQLAMANWTAAVTNTCRAIATPSNFRKLMESYITAGLPEMPVLYRSDADVKMHGPDLPITPIGLACTRPVGVYSVLNISDKGVFWGMDRPTLFTTDAWTLFDRTIWAVLNETVWNITAFIIPSHVTVNGTVLIIAKVTEHGQPIAPGNIVNFTIGGISGELTYRDGFWIGTTTANTTPGLHGLTVRAWDARVLRGSAGVYPALAVGNTSIQILSGDYIPGENYIVAVNVTNAVSPRVYVQFRIWNTTNWTRIIGPEFMARYNSYYTALVPGVVTAKWRGTLLLDVIVNDSLAVVGGSYRYITVAAPPTGNVTSDKTVYKPGELVNITLITAYPPNVTAAVRTVTGPDGRVVCAAAPMVRINATLWTSSCTLVPLLTANGNHTISVNFTDGTRNATASASFEVIAWRWSATKDKRLYVPGELLRLTVQTYALYKPALNFTVSAALLDPAGTAALTNGTIVSAGTWTTNLTIPLNASGGDWLLRVIIIDNENRSAVTKLTFIVAAAGTLSVRPDSWFLAVNASGVYSQRFVINNTGDTKLHNITITPSAALPVTVSPVLIAKLEPGNSTNFTALWNATLAGNFSGSIAISPAEMPAFIVAVQLNYTPLVIPPAISYLTIDPDFYINTTLLGLVVQAAFELSVDSAAPLPATDISIELGGELAGTMAVRAAPESIAPGDSDKLLIEIDTTDLTERSYSGTVAVSSTIGNASAAIRLELIGDLSARFDELENSLAAMSANISRLAAQGHDVSEMLSLKADIENQLTDAKAAWAAGDYATANSRLSQALGSLAALQQQLTEAQARGPPPAGYSGVIWVIAAVVILAIVGVTVFMFRERIRLLIERLLQKLRPPKEVPPEEAPPVSWPEER